MKNFSSLADKKGDEAKKHVKPNVPASADAHQEAARDELKLFIENWIGEDYSLDKLTDQLKSFAADARKDDELMALFKDIKRFFTKSAKSDEYVADKERVRKDARSIIQRTRAFYDGKYRNQLKSLKREIMYINRSIQKDESVTVIQSELQNFVKTLVTDANGNYTVKPEIIGDVQIILQALLKTIKHIPVPPIEKTDSHGSYKFENIVLNCVDILPSNIKVAANIDGVQRDGNEFEIRISRIKSHLRNVKFDIDKRSGFPKFHETGLADIDLGGKYGMEIRVVISVGAEGSNITAKAYCKIDKFKMRLTQTKHDGLFKVLSPIMNMVAKGKIQTAIQNAIEENIAELNKKAIHGKDKAQKKIQDASFVDNTHSAGAPHTTGSHKTDAHKTDAHKTDAHKTDAHKTDAHKTDAHKTDAHKTDAHKTDAHKTDAHKTDPYYVGAPQVVHKTVPEHAGPASHGDHVPTATAHDSHDVKHAPTSHAEPSTHTF